MPYPPLVERELHVRLVGDADRRGRRQVAGQRLKEIRHHRPRPHDHLVHGQGARERAARRVADGQPRPVEREREPAARSGSVREHRCDVGQDTPGYRRIHPRIGQELHRLDRPLAPALRHRSQRDPKIDRLADPGLGRPGRRDPHDGVLDLQPHPDRGPGRLRGGVGSIGGFPANESLEVADMTLVEGEVDREAVDGEPPQVACGEQHGEQAVAALDPADRDRCPATVAGHERDPLEHERAGPAQLHRLEPDVGLEFRHRPGHDPAEPLGLGEPPGQGAGTEKDGAQKGGEGGLEGHGQPASAGRGGSRCCGRRSGVRHGGGFSGRRGRMVRFYAARRVTVRPPPAA